MITTITNIYKSNNIEEFENLLTDNELIIPHSIINDIIISKKYDYLHLLLKYNKLNDKDKQLLECFDEYSKFIIKLDQL